MSPSRECERVDDPQELRALLDQSSSVVVVTDPDSVVTFANKAVERVLGYTPESVVGDSLFDYLHPEDREAIEAAFDRILAEAKQTHQITHRVRHRNGTWHWVESRTNNHLDDPPIEGIVVNTRDVTTRVTHQRKLEQRRAELDRLRRLYTTLWGTTQAILEPVAREDIEDSVCRSLTRSDLYACACIGETTPEGTALESSTWVCPATDAETDQQLRLAPETAERLAGIESVRVLPDVASPAADAPEMTAAGIPLSFEGITHAVLVLYSQRPDAFSDREREALGELGETVGYAMRCVQQNQLLTGDRFVELTLRCRDPVGGSLLPAVRREGAAVTLTECLRIAGGRYLQYWQVEEGTADDLAASLTSDVASVTTLSPDRLVVIETTSSVLSQCLDAGAYVADASVTSNGTTLTVQLSPSVAARQFVEELRQSYPELELRTKRVVDERDDRTPTRAGMVGEELTERQQAALQVAHESGYFGWPRKTSADEAAELMDIATPTFLRHLRLAQQAVLDRLFDE